MKRVLINVEDRELRVAILEDEQLLELYIESLEDKAILNNIYKGRIEGILPGLKAAFVNIGLERNAFLHFDDVRPDMLWSRYKQDHPDVEIPKMFAAAIEADEELPAAQNAEDAVVDATSEGATEGEVAAAEAAEDDEEGTGGGRRRRRGRRGGKRRKQDAQETFDPVRDEVLDAELDTDDEDDDDSETPLAAAPAPTAQQYPIRIAGGDSEDRDEDDEEDDDSDAEAPREGAEGEAASGTSQEDQRNGRSERQRRRRERWEKKKQERKLRRQQQMAGGGQPSQQHQQHQPRPIQPHPTTTAAAANWVPPAMRGAPGTRASANPYDVWSPYNQPPAAKRQWGKQRGGGSDDFGNQRSGQRRNDHRDSQEDFFGPAPVQRRVQFTDDDSQPFGPNDNRVLGAGQYYEEDDYGDGPAPGNEKFPVARQSQGGQRQQQGGGRNQGRNKRRGGRPRIMKKRGGPSYYAARAKKPVEAATDPVEEKPKKARKKAAEAPVPVEATAPEKPKRAPRAKKAVDAETPTTPEVAAAPKRGRKKPEAAVEIAAPAPPPAPAAAPEAPASKPARGRKKAAEATEAATPAPAAPEAAPASAPVEAAEAPAAKPARGRRGKKVDAVPEPAPQSEAAPQAIQPEAAAATTATEASTTAVSPETTGEQATEGRREEGRRDRGRRGRRGRGGRGRDNEATAPAAEGASEAQAAPVDADAAPGTPEAPPPQAPGEQHKPRREERGRDRDRKRGRDRDKDRQRDRDRGDKPRKWVRPPLFTETFKKGDEIMVQVIKEEIGMKGARISTYVSMPGRYLVLLPYPNEEGGISRKVEDVTERKRLKRLLKDISSEEMAFIIRTAGIYREEADIRSDVEFLKEEWKTISSKFQEVEPTNCVYDDHNILYRMARDVFDDNIGEILIDSHVEADKLKGILGKLIPSLVDKVKVYSGADNIFHKYGVEKQIQKAARRKVWLKSGGYLIIDEAEALTAIDVNTGKSVGKDDQEKLILKTNLEAARAVARELKLRDIGGLIVIDFIDMKDSRNRDQVVAELKANLRKDRSKTSVSTISEFGLVEMTRKRVKRSLRKTLFMDCPYCQGAGVVLNEQQIWLHLKHEIVRHLEANKPSPSLNITVNSKIRGYIDQNYRETIRKLEQRYEAEIRFSMSDVFHIENYSIEKAGVTPGTAPISAATGGR